VKLNEARTLGRHIAALVEAGRLRQAELLLAPVLAQRIRFPLLGCIGETVGKGPLDLVNGFLEQVAAQKTEGGWVIIGTALGAQLDRDLPGAFARSRAFIALADVWYGADILGERVPGPALLTHFEGALAQLAPWRTDSDRWVRRTVGVAVHYWAKRSQGAPDLSTKASTLLTLLEPMFSEWDLDSVKGVGWGLKTLGRYYPDLVAAWLVEQLAHGQRRHRALMLRKALTYLSAEQRARATRATH